MKKAYAKATITTENMFLSDAGLCSQHSLSKEFSLPGHKITVMSLFLSFLPVVVEHLKYMCWMIC